MSKTKTPLTDAAIEYIMEAGNDGMGEGYHRGIVDPDLARDLELLLYRAESRLDCLLQKTTLCGRSGDDLRWVCVDWCIKDASDVQSVVEAIDNELKNENH